MTDTYRTLWKGRNRMSMVKQQLELSLGYANESHQLSRRAGLHGKTQCRRQSRSQWWFARMRQVVENAVERTGPRSMA